MPDSAPRLVVVGTVAFDDVETPAGRREGILGGSATYFGVAASYFTRVGVVGVVGEDFPAAYRQVLDDHGLDLRGLETAAGGRTFHWSGRYEGTMNEAQTLATDLNVLATFAPELPAAFRAVPYVFLANTDPRIQASVLAQLTAPRLVVMDTMNLWIDIAREPLLEVMGQVDGVILNDQEARDLSGASNLVAAGRWVLTHGPRHFVIVKKGEHGSFLFTRERLFALPSFPLEEIVDPTGAGDSFAGGVLGYLAGRDVARKGAPSASDLALAMLHGTVVASHTVSDFSLDRLAHLLPEQIRDRVEEFRAFVQLP
jgi:sugar/nucleoside kinase (ribokinase family)